jgi:formylmethanofuran dehydrogenase subunit E
MKTTRGYLRRKIRPEEHHRIQRATMYAKSLLKFEDTGKVEVSLTNRCNPNGIVIRVKHGAETSVNRFIMTQWAREHGYWDACETKSDRKKFVKKFPKLAPSWFQAGVV